METPPTSSNETVAALTSLRNKCAVDLKKLEAQLEGVQSKIESTKVKLEAFNEAIAAAENAGTKPSISNPT